VIVAHLSDLHLGFRAYGRVERGTDVRERDVAAAFERATNEVARIAPHVVVIAGDVFERPDPPAGAIVTLARGLEVLRAALPDTPVLMVAGPRDTPRREGDPGALAAFDTIPNVEAATGLVRSILFERLGLHACLVPHRALRRHPPLPPPEPDPRMRWNLLVLHAQVASRGVEGMHVSPAEWSYVALGGAHRRQEVAERVHYSGSLERVALDPWDEAADEKGFLTVDLESGRVSFHAVPARPVVALAPVRVGRGDPARLRRRVREVTEEVPGGIAGKIVRLRLEGAEPTDLVALQGGPLRELRERALYLAIEAGREPRTPSDQRLLRDAPESLREALRAELARDGLLDEATSTLVASAIPDGVAAELEIRGMIDALDGPIPGLGRASTSIPYGLTGVIGGGGRARRAVLDLFLEAAARSRRQDALDSLWSGLEGGTLEGNWRRAVAAVAESRGADTLRIALERLGAGDFAGADVRDGASSEEGARSFLPDARRPRGAVRDDPEQVAAEFRTAERELAASRADLAEVDGDLEVATMEWLRERQDAETTLQAYRDRARELRGRIREMEAAGPEAPCPTCGRVLGSRYGEVLGELREQWEAVVQDGTWWRSRWEQLESKPESLRELERRSLRLHAAVEAGSERVELLRARLRELSAAGASGAKELAGPPGAVVAALRRVLEARLARSAEVLGQRASRFVCRISGGRILAFSWEGGTIRLQGSEGVLTPLSEEDFAMAMLAMRLAAASLVAASGRVLASLPVAEPFDRLDEEAQIRLLVLARELLADVPRVVLFTRGDVVDAMPELFDYVLEIREERSAGGPPLRPALAGPGRVVLELAQRARRTRTGAR
jgi:DNA repair exonuclease SbcCD nuclease subunit